MTANGFDSLNGCHEWCSCYRAIVRIFPRNERRGQSTQKLTLLWFRETERRFKCNAWFSRRKAYEKFSRKMYRSKEFIAIFDEMREHFTSSDDPAKSSPSLLNTGERESLSSFYKSRGAVTGGEGSFSTSPSSLTTEESYPRTEWYRNYGRRGVYTV